MITRVSKLQVLAVLFLSLFALPAASFAATVQAWLLINHDLKDSVVSTDRNEKEQLEKGGWKTNGTGALQAAPQKGAVPLHRLARAGTDATDRLLEADESKIAGHVKKGFTDEGVLGFVSSEAKPGLVPVHHYTKDGKHFWLIDKSDQPAAEAKGWKAAGISFWLWPVSPSADASKADAKAKTK